MTKTLCALITMTAMCHAEQDAVRLGDASKQADSLTVPVILIVREGLSSLALEIGYEGDTAPLSAEDVKINDERFPWSRRAMMISVNRNRRSLVFSVVDLTGQNVMVRPGDTWILRLTLSHPNELSISKASALDTKGNSVPLAISTDQEEMRP